MMPCAPSVSAATAKPANHLAEAPCLPVLPTPGDPLLISRLSTMLPGLLGHCWVLQLLIGHGQVATH